jgi:hypothetical protein
MTPPSAAAYHHPSRDRTGLAAVLFGVFAGPFAWALQLNVNYALASYACFPHTEARLRQLPGWQNFTWSLLAVNLAALGLSVAPALMSWRGWRAARQEYRSGAAALKGREGSTCFLAACGLMTACGFTAAILFNLFAVLTVQSCTG